MNAKFTIAVAFIVLFVANALAATPADSSHHPTPKPQPLRAVRLTERVVLDGKLNESVWSNLTPITMTQRDPHEGSPASQQTAVALAYDDDAIYIAARLYDTSPDSVRRDVARRDAAPNSDWFVVFLDTYHNHRTGFFFGVNPTGTVYDGTLLNDDWDDGGTWNGIWETRTAIDEKGWTVEIRIPYSQLRFTDKPTTSVPTEAVKNEFTPDTTTPDADGFVWGINFRRDIYRRNETSYYARTPKNESGFVSRFADLIGISRINPPQRMEIVPYVAGSGKFLKHDAGDPFNTGHDYSGNVGADIKVGIGSNLTLDAALNPDFGQAEVDPAVVNLTAFETYYDEKRSFFIEGANIFNFGQGGANNFWNFGWSSPSFFYSRRIGRSPQGSPSHDGFADTPPVTKILGAAKLSGNLTDSWSIGALAAVTAREYATVDSSGVRFAPEQVEPLTYFGVVRSQKEFNDGRQAVGILATATIRDLQTSALSNILNRNAFTGGIDAWSFLDKGKVWVVTGWAGGTTVSGTTTDILNLQQTSRHYFQRPDAKHFRLDSSVTSLSGWATRWYLNKQQGDWLVNAGFGMVSPGYEANDLGFNTRTDLINAHAVFTYQWTKSDGTFRTKRFSVAAWQGYDFDGNHLQAGYFLLGGAELTNFWGFNFNGSAYQKTLDSRATRGGPLMFLPGGVNLNYFIHTNYSKPLGIEAYASGRRETDGGWGSDIGMNFIWQPAAPLKVTTGPEWIRDLSTTQYVQTQSDAAATSTFGNRYIFSNLEQSIFSLNTRVDWSFTPKLSLQLYTQILFAAGNYSGFKELAKPATYHFTAYGQSGTHIDKDANGDYTVQANPNDASSVFTISNPNFNDVYLRGNAVLRWEYFSGSTLYVVWTQSSSDSDPSRDFGLGHSFGRVFKSKADNIFLVKVSYWLSK